MPTLLSLVFNWDDLEMLMHRQILSPQSGPTVVLPVVTTANDICLGKAFFVRCFQFLQRRKKFMLYTHPSSKLLPSIFHATVSLASVTRVSAVTPLAMEPRAQTEILADTVYVRRLVYVSSFLLPQIFPRNRKCVLDRLCSVRTCTILNSEVSAKWF